MREQPRWTSRRPAFDRVLDLSWRRASYSSITADAHYQAAGGEGVGSEPENPGLDDEPPAPAPGTTASLPGAMGDDLAAPDGSPVSPLGHTPGGREVGTLVHAVLEDVDFVAPGWAQDCRQRSRRPGSGAVLSPATMARLADGLAAALTTPLGPLLPGACLGDIARRDRLDELGFELPLAGGRPRTDRCPRPTSPPSSHDTCPPVVRWPGTRSGCWTRCWPPPCAAT